jgi:molybdenum cofactor cytidylyltransferase
LFAFDGASFKEQRTKFKVPGSGNTVTKTEDPKSKTNDVAAIILAAGQSSRMGAFKPLLPFGQTTVIETCIENMRDGGVERIVVVVGQGSRAELLKDQLKKSGVSLAVNPDPQSEMSASIACGVRAVPKGAKAVVINPVDHAAVPGTVIELLINEWREGARLVIPTNNVRGGHPVLIDLSFRAELLELDPDLGLKSFFDAHRNEVKRVAVNSNYIARDMDTWDDYRSLHREVFGVLPTNGHLSELQAINTSTREETN